MVIIFNLFLRGASRVLGTQVFNLPAKQAGLGYRDNADLHPFGVQAVTRVHLHASILLSAISWEGLAATYSPMS